MTKKKTEFLKLTTNDKKNCSFPNNFKENLENQRLETAIKFTVNFEINLIICYCFVFNTSTNPVQGYFTNKKLLLQF